MSTEFRRGERMGRRAAGGRRIAKKRPWRSSVHLTIVYDQGKLRVMETMAISKFKATCLATLERVRRTGEPILVTQRGTPVAQVVPPPLGKPERKVFGCMAGTVETSGDLVVPVADLEDWEAWSGAPRADSRDRGRALAGGGLAVDGSPSKLSST